MNLLWVVPFGVVRLEFDAYRSDLEELSMGPRDAAAMARIDAAQQQYQVQKEKYERLRSDVTIKLKFLEENKVGPPPPAAASLSRTLRFDSERVSFPLRFPGEGDAQAAPPLPQRHFGLLCWQPAAVGADAEAVQHKVETPGGWQALLVRGAVRRSSAPLATSTLPVLTPLHTGRGPLQKETCTDEDDECVWLGRTDGGPAGISEGSSNPSGQIHQQSGGFQCLFLTSLFSLCALCPHKSLLFTSVCCVSLVVSPDYGRRHREMSVSSSERRSPTGTD